MDSLIKQLQRGRESDQEAMPADQMSRRRPRKSVSFDDGDRNKAKKQAENGNTRYSSAGEYEAAIAAATYAINSLPSEALPSKRRSVDGSIGIERGTTTARSFGEDDTPTSKPTGDAVPGKRITKWLSGKESMDDKQPLRAESEKLARVPSRGQKKPAVGDARTIKWVPTLSDKSPNGENSKKEGGEAKPGIPPSLGKPSFSSSGNRAENSWERSEMEKINKRYDKMMARISEWENEKKLKAKRQWEKRERRIELRRAIALQEYKDDLAKIDKIGGGARALASDRRREDVSRMRDNSKKGRSRGRRYYSCFGF